MTVRDLVKELQKHDPLATVAMWNGGALDEEIVVYVDITIVVIDCETPIGDLR